MPISFTPTGGFTYTTAAQLSRTLNRCDFHFSIDLSDAYHLSLWAGCGGELRPVQRPVIVSNGPGKSSEVSWVDAMVNGCTPSTCRGGCDKDLSGIMIDGFVFRFAACQFGQKTAGSPLGSIVRAVARYFARLPDPVHVASWVDNLSCGTRRRASSTSRSRPRATRLARAGRSPALPSTRSKADSACFRTRWRR